MWARSWGGAAVAFALIVALGLPVNATAKKDHGFIVPASRSAEFNLKATNGYAVSVFASHGQVWLTARRGSEAEVSYLALGVTSGERVKASFGDLGSIAVRFHPSGPPRQRSPEDGCQGEGRSVQRGTFVGKISFEGEQAYTTLNASRARGKKTESFKQICSENGETGNFHSPVRLTLLGADSESEQASFQAIKFLSKAHPSLSVSLFSASIIEGKKRLTIFRTVTAEADAGSFTATASGKTPVLATVSPPAPLSGTATYEKAKGSSPSWTGSLNASFPGLGVVPLTGPDWTAELNPWNKKDSGSGSFTGSFFGS